MFSFGSSFIENVSGIFCCLLKEVLNYHGKHNVSVTKDNKVLHL